MYKNTHRPCYVSEKAYIFPFESSKLFHLLRLMGVSVPFLHIESTDSIITMLKDVGMTVPTILICVTS